MFKPSIMGCKSFILGSLDHAKRSVVRGLRISSLRGKLAVSKINVPFPDECTFVASHIHFLKYISIVCHWFFPILCMLETSMQTKMHLCVDSQFQYALLCLIA